MSGAMSLTPAPAGGPPSGLSGWTRKVLDAGAQSAQALRLRLDSWANALTGLGTSRDKSAYTLPYVDALLTPQMLEVLFHTDDIASRMVSAVPDECFREDWHIVNTNLLKTSDVMRKNGASLRERYDAVSNQAKATNAHERAAELEADLRKFGVRTKLREALTWGRLYGLGAILVGLDDGMNPSEEVDWGRIRGVQYLTCLDKRDLVPWQWYADVQAPKFGDVAVYQVQPVGVFVGGMPYQYKGHNNLITVHESRLIRFGGELTSKREKLRNQGADYSILQKCFRALQLVNNNWQSAATLLSDASQGVFKIKGLIDMISSQPDTMTARMQLVDQMRSTLRAIILDADGEDFKREATPFTGIPEMLDKTWERAASAARMPKSVLIGTASAGLNKGDMEIRWWYDTIKGTIREVVIPEAEHVIRFFATARGYSDPEAWTVRFDPLWQMTQAEQADYELKIAQKDHIYIDDGVTMAEEIALSRLGSGSWSADTTIDVDTRKSILAARLAQAEKTATAPTPPAAAGGVPASLGTPGSTDPPQPVVQPVGDASTNKPPVATPGAMGSQRRDPSEATRGSPDPHPASREDAVPAKVEITIRHDSNAPPVSPMVKEDPIDRETRRLKTVADSLVDLRRAGADAVDDRAVLVQHGIPVKPPEPEK